MMIQKADMQFALTKTLCSLLLVATMGVAQAACGPYEVTLYEYGSLYYKDDTGNYVGIDPDVVAEVARRSGCVLNSHLDSRARTWAMMADGTLDMTVSGFATPEREVHARFINYINSRNFLIVHNKVAERVKSLRAFAADKQLRLAVVRGFKHGATIDPWIDLLRLQGRVDEYGDAETVARLFALGRDDAFFAEPLAWGPLLKRNELEGKVRKLDVAPQDSANGGLVLSKKRVREADFELMRRTIAEMRADGSLAAIFARHLTSEIAKDFARVP